DPLATGVLVLAINKATKALQFISADEKGYIATLSLGQATTTYDAEGEVVEEKPFTGYNHLEETLQQFVGRSKQTPPIYSAIKIKGKKLYEYARDQQDVDIEPRDIEIKDIKLLNTENEKITFYVRCSKGTYVRSLCVDLAHALGYPGHMSALKRVESGQFTLDQCHTLEELSQQLAEPISLDEVFASYDRIVVEDPRIVINGRPIKSDIDHRVAVYSPEGHVLAIYGPDGRGYLKSLRGLF
ncbi:MAG: tRNA pseudouridine(55) synthase TruB, partial [bacterium]